jgi:hypothetical protein
MSELFHTGDLLEVVLPSTRRVTIRQHNGDDEGILSNFQKGQDGSSLSEYLAGLIVKGGDLGNGKATAQEVEKWGLKDKYYLCFVARVHSLGKILKFRHTEVIENPNGTTTSVETEYEEDLTKYMFDFNNFDQYVKTNPFQITPYPNKTNPVIMEKLSSGKDVRWRIMDSESEKLSLQTPEALSNRNDQFLVRKLEILQQGEWKDVKKFSMFTAQDMIELRASVKKYDTLFQPFAEFESPKTKKKFSMDLMTSPAFFYPEEI